MQLPDFTDAEVVVPAPERGPGHWAGAPAAAFDGERFVLAWREMHPYGTQAVVHLATSLDGLSFDEVAAIKPRFFDAAALDRPALVQLADGDWRIYLSCATARSKHWWIDSLTASRFENLPRGTRRIILPGDAGHGVKDPVVRRSGNHWQMWATRHPLDVPVNEDRLVSHHLTSRDGLDWVDQGAVLAGRTGDWDARGARITAVVQDEPLAVLYDARPEIAHASTGLAIDQGDGLQADPTWRATAGRGDGVLRFVANVPLPDGTIRWYAEKASADGAHDLVTTLTHP